MYHGNTRKYTEKHGKKTEMHGKIGNYVCKDLIDLDRFAGFLAAGDCNHRVTAELWECHCVAEISQIFSNHTNLVNLRFDDLRFIYDGII